MQERSWRLVGLTLLLVAVGTGLWWGLAGGAQPIPVGVPDESAAGSEWESVPSPDATAAAELVVHVAGAVQRPGLVSVRPGSRVADAIAAAGGVTGEAIETAVNLAAPVSDGMQVVVPSMADPSGAGSTGGDGRTHVNQASVAELEALPGVGPVLAERIAAHRDANGPFETVEDLLDVPGIGESKLDAMRDAIAVP